ncbi:multicopper oxidase family protein [Nocardioides panacisoli]|uniref:multicopper oxidase family protein n=1 Tax=Nocardioides panacisoli TaxID=627624 RepID=UPI001C62BAE5|nr:multicopper oxidase family protein [Nocardioides panacisoli]QYJ05415.1 multicopper oxidase family protein [Nocardioides panacisoli]
MRDSTSCCRQVERTLDVMNAPFSLAAARFDRRRFLISTGAAAVAMGTAACSSDSSDLTRLGSRRVEPTSPLVEQAERARRFAGARTTTLNLRADARDVDLGGAQVRTWAYGDAVPGEVVRVQRGDVLRARVENKLPQPTTIHWHGLELRNDMDGVPGLTQEAIPTGSAMDYEFVAATAGTHWFHSHVGAQRDRGLYAPLIVEDPADGADYDDELVVVLDDWLDGISSDPDEVLRSVRDSGMGRAGGHGGMMGSDFPTSDLIGPAGEVDYPHMLANGRTADAPHTVRARAGQRLRLRIINAAADTAFRVGVPGTPLRITHTDGFPVEPMVADSLLLGMGERVDAIVTVPEASTPVVALAEGRGSHAAVVLRVGTTSSAVDTTAAAARLAGSGVAGSLDLVASERVRIDPGEPDVTHDLVLSGPDRRGNWLINDQTYDPDEGLPVRTGQRVRLRLRNASMMFHPVHLHGHTVQVRGRDGGGPRKDTVLLLPHQELEVEFDAVNPGQWLTHCHNLYHGETGMKTVLSYLD